MRSSACSRLSESSFPYSDHFAADEIAQAGHDVFAYVARADCVAANQPERANDFAAGDFRAGDHEHFFFSHSLIFHVDVLVGFGRLHSLEDDAQQQNKYTNDDGQRANL